MAGRLTRRTVLVSGVAAVAAGGLVALSKSRRSPAAAPPFGQPPAAQHLPVASVPAPTDRPVDIVYCAGWDAVGRTPVSPMAASVARAQDTAGGQYAAVLLVDGVARAVVEVCWSAHHAQVWDIDAAGRRYRGVAYRRWPDGRLRLFEVRSWQYATTRTPEFDPAEPTLRIRVNRGETGAIKNVDIKAELPDGGAFDTVRDWADWPESRRPPDHVAVPSVEGWAPLAGMTGRVTVRSGPAVVPARFPWRPPRPLGPRRVTEMVTDGTRSRTHDGRVLTIRRTSAGTIRLPSGRLLVADPFWLDTDPQPLVVPAPPGRY